MSSKGGTGGARLGRKQKRGEAVRGSAGGQCECDAMLASLLLLPLAAAQVSPGRLSFPYRFSKDRFIQLTWNRGFNFNSGNSNGNNRFGSGSRFGGSSFGGFTRPSPGFNTAFNSQTFGGVPSAFGGSPALARQSPGPAARERYGPTLVHSPPCQSSKR